MGYRNLQECVRDLERTGQLVRISAEIDPYLEMAEIQRRIYRAGGPALLFERVKGTRFPMLGNLYGTMERTRFLFRDTLDLVRRLVEIKIDPGVIAKSPFRYLRALPVAWAMRPKRVWRAPLLECETTLDQLPSLQSWPNDGGPYITLPAVYTEHPDTPGWAKSNLGMYRIQLAGNDYLPNREVGLHYQIHRGIGVHHAAAIRRGEKLHVNIYVGGPPSLPLSAVMPLPEGLSELTFAGALSGQRMRMVAAPHGGLPLLAEADFCLSGTIDPSSTKPEGPFGDHLGYYSLAHDFPMMTIDKVYHRRDAIWPFTVVGRPPQEDTSFGEIIHEITGPAIPSVLPGVKAVNAVDAAGVHPLLLAIGSERYVPYAGLRRPMEILTQANALLGQGQLSLAKYLLIVAGEDNPQLDIHDIGAFLKHLLERVDWERDLHFQTRTTMDTLDYSGSGLNSGSKVVIAAAGGARRSLPTSLPDGLKLPLGFSEPRVVGPGILAVKSPTFRADYSDASRFSSDLGVDEAINQFPLVVLVDDSAFVAHDLTNFLWTTFTRSNPAVDIDGIGAFTEDKHWGCRGSLVIDARLKPHHAPPLIEDPAMSRRVDQLAVPGGPLHGLI